MKATQIIAKRKSLCPGCSQYIFPGVPCKVYNDKWYHVECWQEMWDKIAEEKDEKKVNKSTDKYLDMEEKQLETANELRTIVLQIEILTGRVREIAKEMGSW